MRNFQSNKIWRYHGKFKSIMQLKKQIKFLRQVTLVLHWKVMQPLKCVSCALICLSNFSYSLLTNFSLLFQRQTKLCSHCIFPTLGKGSYKHCCTLIICISKFKIRAWLIHSDLTQNQQSQHKAWSCNFLLQVRVVLIYN